jgi:hypothetical protein
MQTKIAENNEIYDSILGSRPYSPEGFFNVCPYSDQGVSYPTDLTFSGNVIYPAKP